MKKLILLALMLLPTSARACGACMDITLSLHAPFILPLFGVVFVWLIASSMLQMFLMRSRHASVAIFPSVSGLLRMIGFGLLALIVLYVLSQGSLFVPLALIELVWLVSLVTRSIDFGVRVMPAAPSASHGFCRFFLGMQFCFLALAAAVMPLANHYSRSASSLVSMLGVYDNEVRRLVIPGLIARGEESVEPLVGAAKTAFDSSEKLEDDRRLIPAVYCLGRIGGAKASAYLASAFKAKVDFNHRNDYPWQRAVCLAYAQAGGARAALDLIPLYRSLKSGPDADEAWVILAALALTRSKPGAQFVCANMGDLVNKAESQAEDADLAAVIVSTFLSMGVPDSLRDLPVARLIGDRRFYFLDPVSSLAAAQRPSPERYGSQNYVKLWREHQAEVRRYWMQTLR